MATFKNRLDFLLHLTNYFHGHWEDPEWGRRAENQVLIHVAISELAAKISNAELKQVIQEATQKGISTAGQAVVKGR
jgi:protein-disulfide isomerase